MTRSRRIALLLASAGIAIAAMAYFWLAAPWGFPPESEAHSNPVVPFAPVVFILGLALLLVSPVAIELVEDDKVSP